MTGREDFSALAAKLEDGDTAIAGAIANTATVFGFILETKDIRPLDTVPILVRGDVDLPRLWKHRARLVRPRRSPRQRPALGCYR
jgi:hypothetical protein